jgi:hypothetical protein
MLIGSIPAGMVLGIYGSDVLGWVTGICMFLAGVVFHQLSTLGLRANKIDDFEGSFRGACDTFLSKLPEHA